MSENPVNLAFRFLLELALLAAIGQWAWQQGAGVLSWVYAAVAVIVVAALWGTFKVQSDESVSGKVLVPVPETVRILLEWVLFLFGTWCLYDAGHPTWGGIFFALVVIHYALSYDRTLRMLKLGRQ